MWSRKRGHSSLVKNWYFRIISPHVWTSLVTQIVKNLPAMKGIWVQSLGQEEPLEKGMATHSSILAWRIPWTKEPVGYHPWGRKELDTTEQLMLRDGTGGEREMAPT